MTDFSRQDLVIPVSGWVPNIDPGKKCQHGVYIASTQEDQTHAQDCGICRYLREAIGKTPEEISERIKFLWNRLDKKEEKQ
jgi:hypothetical protein